MPFLTFPLALFGLLSVPLLASIYWLRSRQRRRVMSSLMLWAGQREAREGGRRWQHWQMPLLFLLELLALLLLSAAATEPQMASEQARRPITIVLDGSYSMQAGSDTAAKERAREAVVDTLRELTGFEARFIEAGPSPQVLAEHVSELAEAQAALDRWQCRAAAADLNQAMTLARQMSGPRARLLVVTDHEPANKTVAGRVRWRAFGEGSANVAIVNATRGGRAQKQILLEVANLSAKRSYTKLTVNGESRRLSLKSDETRQLRLTVPDPAKPVKASLSADALTTDNRITLLPTQREPVQVNVAVQDQKLRDYLRQAVRSRNDTALTEGPAHLHFTSDGSVAEPGNTTSPSEALADRSWLVRCLVSDESAEPYVGPFVIDRTHPLTEGLSLEGVVWAAAPEARFPGRAVLTAGDVPLIAEGAAAAGRRVVYMNLSLANSNLQHTPNLPVLMYNLIKWRRRHLPGINPINLRLGQQARLSVGRDTDSVRHIQPNGSSQKRALPTGGALTLPADQVGVHEVKVTDSVSYRYSVNALSRSESDLSETTAGAWGQWRDREVVRRQYRSVRWALLLPVLGILVLHAFLLMRGRGGMA